MAAHDVGLILISPCSELLAGLELVQKSEVENFFRGCIR